MYALLRVSDLSTGDLGSFVDSVGTPDDPEAQKVRTDLRTATDAFSSAADAVDSPLVAPLKVVPVGARSARCRRSAGQPRPPPRPR